MSIEALEELARSFGYVVEVVERVGLVEADHLPKDVVDVQAEVASALYGVRVVLFEELDIVHKVNVLTGRRAVVARSSHQAAQNVVQAAAGVLRRPYALADAVAALDVERLVGVALLVVEKSVQAERGAGELAHDLRVHVGIVAVAVAGAGLERQQIVLLCHRATDHKGQELAVCDVLIHGDVDATRLLEQAFVVPVGHGVDQAGGDGVVVAVPEQLHAGQVRVLLGVRVRREEDGHFDLVE